MPVFLSILYEQTDTPVRLSGFVVRSDFVSNVTESFFSCFPLPPPSPSLWCNSCHDWLGVKISLSIYLSILISVLWLFAKSALHDWSVSRRLLLISHKQKKKHDQTVKTETKSEWNLYPVGTRAYVYSTHTMLDMWLASSIKRLVNTTIKQSLDISIKTTKHVWTKNI